jgi:hypothetical protein
MYVSRNRKERKLFSIYSPRSWEMLRSLGTESGLQTISIGTSGEESILKTSDKETTIGEGADRTLKALKRSHISFPPHEARALQSWDEQRANSRKTKTVYY